LDWIILAQRIALPVLGHQQPARIRMAVEDDAEEIPHLALEPVRGRPDAAHRADVRVATGEPHLDADPRAAFEGDEDVHDLEPRIARPEIDGGQLGEEIEPD